MSLWIVKGHLGAGKTLFATKLIYDSGSHYKAIYCNVPVSEKVIKRLVAFGVEYYFISFKDISDFWLKRWKYEEKKLLIIDEAHFEVNSRDWQKFMKSEDYKNIIRFFSMSRKAGFDVYLIAQNDTMLDKQLRGMAAGVIEIRNVKYMKVFGFLPMWIFFPPLYFMNVAIYYAGWDTRDKYILQREFYIRNLYYGLFDTSFNYLEHNLEELKEVYQVVYSHYVALKKLGYIKTPKRWFKFKRNKKRESFLEKFLRFYRDVKQKRGGSHETLSRVSTAREVAL
ncbi:MAG: hypothetical protein DRP11_03535 [Candidatus Aenigmatarchaeota archaeon]|nr:MAG: hypothetical protein DRP11_03535 [Candidatus Aenigmarchaeota archaeon]